MSTTTCLNINTLNVHDSDCITWHDTALIKVEAMLLLSSFFVLKIFCNWMSLKNNFISLVFNFHLLFFSNRLIMSDINMSIMLSLLSTMLPNMWTKYSTSSSIHNMCTSMEASQCITPLLINSTSNLLTNKLLWI